MHMLRIERRRRFEGGYRWSPRSFPFAVDTFPPARGLDQRTCMYSPSFFRFFLSARNGRTMPRTLCTDRVHERARDFFLFFSFFNLSLYSFVVRERARGLGYWVCIVAPQEWERISQNRNFEGQVSLYRYQKLSRRKSTSNIIEQAFSLRMYLRILNSLLLSWGTIIVKV